MYLQQLIQAQNKEDYMNSLTQEQKLTLYQEIHNDAEAKSKELVAQETMKAKLEEEYNQELEKLKALGINSEEDLEKEIQKIDSEIKSQVIEYSTKLGEV